MSAGRLRVRPWDAGPGHADPTRRGVLAAVVAGLAATLAACGDEETEVTDNAPTSDDQTPAEALRLGLTEWSIEASASVLVPGTVEVVVTNAGGTGHDVSITGEAGTWATRVLAPGEQTEFSIQTVPGEELSLVCTVAGHHSAGMHRTVSVAE